MKKIAIFVPENEDARNDLAYKLKEQIDLFNSEVHYIYIGQITSYTGTLPPIDIPSIEQQGEMKTFYIELLKNFHQSISNNEAFFHCFFDHSPKSAAIDYINEVQINLAIAGTRAKKGFKDFFKSSFTEHLTHYAPCDILILRTKK